MTPHKNNIFIYLHQKRNSIEIFDQLKEKFPFENGNVVEMSTKRSLAEILLKKYFEQDIQFDIFIIDLQIPKNTRKTFIHTIHTIYHEFGCELLLVGDKSKLNSRDVEKLCKNKYFIIPDLNIEVLFVLLENIIEKRYIEKKFDLVNRIDDAINLEVDSKEILSRIVDITLNALGLKICWVSRINYASGRIEIVALTGFGAFEDQYKAEFDIPLTEETVTTECINRQKQIQYKNIYDDNCPFKYKELARKIGLKSILLTPIFEKNKKGRRNVIATLNLYTDFPHEFLPDELELAQIIATKTASVLSIKEVYDDERVEALQRIKRIERVAAEINKNVRNQNRVFETIVKEGLNLIKAEQGCIKLCNHTLPPRICFSHCKNAPCAQDKCGDEGIINYLIKEKKGLIIQDINTSPFFNLLIKQRGTQSVLAIPLMQNSDVIGVLMAEHPGKGYFKSHHQQIFEAIARHAVIAIDNTERYKKLKKRLDSQRIIEELIEVTSQLKAFKSEKARNKYRKTQLEEIIQLILRKSGKIFNAKSGYIVLANLNSNFAIRKKEWEFGLEDYEPPIIEIGVVRNGKVTFQGNPCIVGKVIADGQIYNCSNASNDPYYLEYGGKDLTKSEIVVPLKFQEQIFGAFSLDSIYENGFSKEDEEILASIAIQIALLFKRFDYLNALFDLNKPFKNIDNLELLYREILDRTIEVLGTENNHLQILERDQLVFKGRTEKKLLQKMDFDTGMDEIIQKIIKEMRPIIISNVQDSDIQYKYKSFACNNNLFALMSVPILSKNMESQPDLIGVISIFSRRICNFTSLDVQLIELLTDKAGEAIKKARLIKQLEEIARIDKNLTTATEELVIQNISNIAKELLSADQVVLYQYNSQSAKNMGFKTPPIISGEFIDKTIEAPSNFTKDSFVVLLLKEASKEFFVNNHFDNTLIQHLYKNRTSSNKRFYEREKLKAVIILKLIYMEEVIGILFINYRYDRSFSEEDKRIARTFANKAAIAIWNANQIRENKETLRRINNNLKAIQLSGNEIVENLNKEDVSVKDILRPIMNKALELIGVKMGYISIPKRREKNTQIVICSEDYRELENCIIDHYYPNDDWIAKRRKFSIFQDNYKKNSDDEYHRFADMPWVLSCYPQVVFEADKDVCSALRVPIYSDKHFLGMIVLESEKENAFIVDDALGVRSLANQASLALQNYYLIQQLRKLREIDIAIIKELNNLDYVLDVILKAALDLVNKGYGEISLLLDENTLKIEKAIPKDIENDKIDIHRSFYGLAIITKRIQYEPDIENSRYKNYFLKKRRTIKSDLVIPLLLEDNLIGIVNIGSDQRDDFSRDDRKILEMLSRQASIAIHLSQQTQRLIDKEKQASIGIVTRESVHWIGNKIGPIPRRIEDITHELNQLNKEGIVDNQLFESLMSNLSIIRKGASSALSIKSDLIDVSKQKDNFNLINLLKETIDNFRIEYNQIEIKSPIKSNTHQYRIHLDSSISDFRVDGDINHIGRMFHYILKNAYQAIEDIVFLNRECPIENFIGEIIVRIILEADYLTIEFEDNGIGIKKEVEPHIFRPFHTTKGADRGSGVGLFFCKRMMKELNGKIYVKRSEYKKGTVFALEFPRDKSTHHPKKRT